MIKFTQFEAFLSIDERDKFNEKGCDKPCVYINPDHVVAIEPVKVKTETGYYPSTYHATRIHTIKSQCSWTVEGDVEAVANIINGNY